MILLRKMKWVHFNNQQPSSLRDWLLPMLMNGQVVSATLNNQEEEWLMAAEPEEKYGER